MGPPTSTAHWVRPNEASRVPRNHMVLDCEAHVEVGPGGETHTFRLAVTSCDRMAKSGERWAPTEWGEHETPDSVWDWVDKRARAKERTVLVAHNAAYDLRVANGLDCLARRGWVLQALSLTSGSCWGQWRNGSRSLILVDSLTWLPLPLASIGLLLGQPKRPLPTQRDSTALWWGRCRADVQILRDAWMRMILWLRATDAGNWRPTGAGMAWSFWRHRHYTRKVLAHHDLELRALERRAAWTGRAEAWRTGKLAGGPWFELDFRCAYASIAAEARLPYARIGVPDRSSWYRWEKPSPTRTWLLECQVTTDAPTVPAEREGRIVWPVGTFPTVLWDHEARLAVEFGADVKVTNCHAYGTFPLLESWARWVLGVVNSPPGEWDPIVRTMVKHWSRALIGKFGARWAPWEHYADSDRHDVTLWWIGQPEAGTKTRLLHVGNRLLTQGDLRDADSAVPQIMSWIMAAARVQLWRAMVTAGLDHVAYVDTDSLIVDGAGLAALGAAGLPGLVQKGRWQRLEVLGTRKLVADGALRASGVPRGAVRTGGKVWAAEAWDGLTSSLTLGEPDRVSVRRRTVRLMGEDGRRRRLKGGGTAPWRL